MILAYDSNPTIIDVRSSTEFMEGNIPGSINIPLLNIPKRIEDIMQLPKPIVICASNGMKSSHASNFLKNLGIDCLNGGSWKDYKNKVLSVQ